eukprot:TRINITY_DN10097_c0_g1_i1.p1 TRINITY_DN10097_c0_g1~~TRINITY_DN10097_c0_g1_i1.p1  ORF type:complete len:223 (+),score=49.05 TRINITY_DN10097_c0_g1_i1:129-797(+)
MGFMEEKDPKTRLSHLVQKMAGTTINKNDIEYKSGRLDGSDEWQSTVQLNSLPDRPEFAGEIANTRKLAEQEAAKIALENYQEELDKLSEDPKYFQKENRHKRKAASEFGSQKMQRMADPMGINSWKSLLHQLCASVVKKPIGKEGIAFTTTSTENDKGKAIAYTCTVQMPIMPDKWGSETFTGDTCISIKAAEHSAAEKAFKLMQDDPDNSSITFIKKQVS